MALTCVVGIKRRRTRVVGPDVHRHERKARADRAVACVWHEHGQRARHHAAPRVTRSTWRRRRGAIDRAELALPILCAWQKREPLGCHCAYEC